MKIPPWSYSSLKTYETCPRKYQAEKVTKEVPFTQTDATIYGTELHLAAEEYIRDGKPIDPRFDFVQPYLDKLVDYPGIKFCELKLGVKKNDDRLIACDFFDPAVWFRGVADLVIVDDSAEPGVFEKLVEEYGNVADVICFPNNRSQWWAMDFMVSYCDTEYIFYLEDDWELLKPGYLNQSKAILQKYREVGVVDTSWRTFEWQGIDSYHGGLVDNMFYWKKPWKITDHHVAWHAWVGSPNLRRRDDLIMLGRVEKWHNEWNIDRKFTALGFKGRSEEHTSELQSH